MTMFKRGSAYSLQDAKYPVAYTSASFGQSLGTALIVGMIAALLGVAASVTLYRLDVVWYLSAAAGPLVDTLVVICLVTTALEQARKRAIRRVLENSFLNHHVRNALTQMSMALNLTDVDQQDRFTREAVNRISEALFRVANSTDLTSISLEVDLAGKELTRKGEERDKQMWEEQAG